MPRDAPVISALAVTAVPPSRRVRRRRVGARFAGVRESLARGGPRQMPVGDALGDHGELENSPGPGRNPSGRGVFLSPPSTSGQSRPPTATADSSTPPVHPGSRPTHDADKRTSARVGDGSPSVDNSQSTTATTRPGSSAATRVFVDPVVAVHDRRPRRGWHRVLQQRVQSLEVREFSGLDPLPLPRPQRHLPRQVSLRPSEGFESHRAVIDGVQRGEHPHQFPHARSRSRSR